MIAIHMPEGPVFRFGLALGRLIVLLGLFCLTLGSAAHAALPSFEPASRTVVQHYDSAVEDDTLDRGESTIEEHSHSTAIAPSSPSPLATSGGGPDLPSFLLAHCDDLRRLDRPPNVH